MLLIHETPSPPTRPSPFLSVPDPPPALHFVADSVVDKHHKSTTTLKRRNALIRTYYDHLPFFAFCCIGKLTLACFIQTTRVQGRNVFVTQSSVWLFGGDHCLQHREILVSK